MPSSGVQTCARSEEHTSELQSHSHLVCRLLLDKKIASLTPREERVLRMRFGIGMNPDHTLEEVGQQFFFLNDRAPPEIYPLPLKAPLPISTARARSPRATIQSTPRTRPAPAATSAS